MSGGGDRLNPPYYADELRRIADFIDIYTMPSARNAAPFNSGPLRQYADALDAGGLAMRCPTCGGSGEVAREVGADQCLDCSSVGFVALR